MTRMASEPNSGIFFNKGGSTFQNNAQNIFGSPSGGFKNIFPSSTHHIKREGESNVTTSRLET